jgi:putative redox protein
VSEILIHLEENFATEIYSTLGALECRTDAPKENGGIGVNLSPTDLLAASLGSCILTILSLFAKKSKVELFDVKAKVIKTPALGGGIEEILVDVYIEAALEDSVKEKLEYAARHCPVHQLISDKVKQSINFYYNQTLK